MRFLERKASHHRPDQGDNYRQDAVLEVVGRARIDRSLRSIDQQYICRRRTGSCCYLLIALQQAIIEHRVGIDFAGKRVEFHPALTLGHGGRSQSGHFFAQTAFLLS